jgi:hypothetical protein
VHLELNLLEGVRLLGRVGNQVDLAACAITQFVAPL